MKIKKLSLLVVIAMLIGLFVGCGEKVDSNEIKKYSDKIVEDNLIAFKNEDIKRYMESFDPKLKELLTEDKVKESMKLINSKIGTYTEGSLKFQKAVKQSKDGKKYITVIYSAKFSDEPKDVVITAVFGDDENHKLQTFLLNSPKLRK